MNSKDLTLKYIDSWNTRDFSIIDDVLSESATYYDPVVSQNIPKEELKGYMGSLIQAFPDLKYEIQFMASGENFSTFEWLMVGKNTGDTEVHPATHKDIRLRGADIIQINKGKMETISVYFDMQDYLNQLGLINE